MGGVRTRMRKNYTPVVADSSNLANTSITQIRDEGRSNYMVNSPESDQILSINRLCSLNIKSINCSPLPKVRGVSWILSIAATARIGKAIELLDTVGSSVVDLSMGNDFQPRANVKGAKISILAFEVAKTVIRGSRLVQSFSDQNILFLKTAVVSSEGAKALISEDENEILRIAASDKREELESFIREVARFGDICIDARWHSLDRYFKKFSREHATRNLINPDSEIEQLMTLVNHTQELLIEVTTLDKIYIEYNEKLKAENISTTVQKGDLAHLTAEIKNQLKIVKSLKKKSFWSKSIEEVVEKLVSIVHFLLLKIKDAFDYPHYSNDSTNGFESDNQKLGPAGIALHYANIITQIETIGSLPSPIPSSMRDAFYESLPRTIRLVLPKRLRSSQVDLESNQIKAEMDKTLQWLGPIARNTTKALQGFCWSGGWANFRSKVNQEITHHRGALRIETLYHADKEKTEACILQLVVWLHHYLTIVERSGGNPPMNHHHRSLSMLTVQDHKRLESVGENISKLGLSRSQYFSSPKTGLSKFHRLGKSVREYSTSSSRTNGVLLRRQPSCDPVIDFDIDRAKVLDIIDGLEII